jgi:hypothetical protein
MTMFLMGSLTLGFVGCAADSMKSSSEPPPGYPIAQTDEEKDQPPSGEVQERAVPRLAPGGALFRPMIPGAPLPLPGQFVVQTFRGDYLTVVDGGGRTTNVIHTDATGIGSWETFRLLPVDPVNHQYAFQTVKGNYMTAVNGGGGTGDPLHTDATQIQSWEKFRFVLDQYGWRNAIQTVNGHYLTAVGGGGKTTDAIHTDAVKVGYWEEFYVWKCGDLGSGYQYTISAKSDPYGFVFAYGGGGRVVTRADVFVAGAIGVLNDYTKRPAPFDNNWQRFRLIRQGDGSYAIQTSNGVNYITAIQGGGLPSGTISWDDLVTDRTQVQAWEKFRFVDQGNCTYVIQTSNGHYLGKSTAAPGTALGVFSTNVSDIKNATKFRLGMVF